MKDLVKAVKDLTKKSSEAQVMAHTEVIESINTLAKAVDALLEIQGVAELQDTEAKPAAEKKTQSE